MATDDYQEYHGQDILLVMDGRGHSGGDRNLSLYLTAKLAEETDISLKLENVTIANSGMSDYLPGSEERRFNEFARATIRKEYIMGVFQTQIPTNDELNADDNNLNKSG
jgi:hypothetical protein